MNYPKPREAEDFKDNMRWRTKNSNLIAYLGEIQGGFRRYYLFRTKNGRYFLQEERGDVNFIWPMDLDEAVSRYESHKNVKDAVCLMSFDEAFPDGIEDA